jgi:hypothetical protein
MEQRSIPPSGEQDPHLTSGGKLEVQADGITENVRLHLEPSEPVHLGALEPSKPGSFLPVGAEALCALGSLV